MVVVVGRGSPRSRALEVVVVVVILYHSPARVARVVRVVRVVLGDLEVLGYRQ